MQKQLSTPLVLIFAVSFALYINTLGHDYALDDTLMITENKLTKQGIEGIGSILTTDAFFGFFEEEKALLEGGRYRPLSHITFAVEYEFFGPNPFIGHLINILLHALLCCLIFITLKKLLPSNSNNNKWFLSLPFIITIIYAVHPIHTEVVANIKGRDELLSMLFSIAALYFYIKFLQEKNKIFFGVLTSGIFLLALLSKENALTFLAVIPLSIYYFTKHTLKDNLKNIYILIIPIAIFFLLRYNALGYIIGSGITSKEILNNPFLYATTSERYATIFYTMFVYLRLLIFPHPLTHDYYPNHIPIVGWEHPLVILSFLIYASIGVFAIKSLKTKHTAGYGIWFFLLTFSIFSNILFSIGTFMNERFMFMPSLGFCIAAGYFIQKIITGEIIKHKDASYITTVLFFVILAGFSYKTIDRNKAWKDDYTLFTTDVKTSDKSIKVNVSAGGALIEKALKPEISEAEKQLKLEKAINYLERGVSLHQNYLSGWLLLGNAYVYSGYKEKSMEAYMRCLEINPNYELAYNNLLMLGRRARRENNLEVAQKSFEKLKSRSPENSEYIYELALVYEKKEEFEKTIDLLHEVIELNPGHYKAIRKIGEIKGKVLGDIEESLKYLNRAYEINPDDLTTLANLGVAYGIINEFEKSLEFLYKALEVSPEDKNLMRNISFTYLRKGEPEKAQKYSEKVEE